MRIASESNINTSSNANNAASGAQKGSVTTVIQSDPVTPVQVGQKISGAFLSSTGDKATIILKDGSSLALILDGNQSKALQGQAVQVTITEVVNGNIHGLLEVLSDQVDAGETGQSDARLDRLLGQLGVESGPKQREALSMILRYGLTITGQNVNAVKQEGMQIDKIAQLAPAVEESLLEQVEEMPLKEVVKALIDSIRSNESGERGEVTQLQTPSGLDKSQVEASMKHQSGRIPMDSGDVLGKETSESVTEGNLQMDADGPDQKIMRGSKEMSEMGDFKEKNLSNQNDARVLGSNETKNTTAERLVDGIKTLIIDALKNGSSIEKAAFLRTLDVQGTIRNLVMSEHLLGKPGHMNLFSMFERLSATLRTMSSGFQGVDALNAENLIKMAEKLDGVALSDLDGHLAVLEEISDLIDDISKNESSRTHFFKEIEYQKEALPLMKDGVDFLKQASQNLGFVQVKVMYDDEPAHFEMAYKKRKKAPGEGDRILISLDTHHIGLVQSLIDMRQQSVNVQFHVENATVQEQFADSFAGLEESLRQVLGADGKTWRLHVGFYGEEMTIKELFADDQSLLDNAGFDRFV